ncbi:hypothetical protein ACTWJ9_30770 (plasmid) [Streptomyces sp. GDS52]|uniref:hypothetical protein n=1 Tax=Streptomyces sp. GDS52 TaxID=3406419 RepID=UPI003FD3BA7B
MASQPIRHASISVDLPAPATPTRASMPCPAVSTRRTAADCSSDSSNPAATWKTSMAAAAWSAVSCTAPLSNRSSAWARTVSSASRMSWVV